MKATRHRSIRLEQLVTRCSSSWAIPMVLIAPLIWISTGCGASDGLNRKAISGKVTVDGAPVPNGSVSFEPLSPGGLGSGAPIAKGTYKIEAKDGLPPGKYRVSITGDDGTFFGVSEGKMPGDEEMPPIKQLVPPNWNADGKHNIEVTEDGPFEFNFDIKSKEEA